MSRSKNNETPVAAHFHRHAAGGANVSGAASWYGLYTDRARQYQCGDELLVRCLGPGGYIGAAVASHSTTARHLKPAGAPVAPNDQPCPCPATHRQRSGGFYRRKLETGPAQTAALGQARR